MGICASKKALAQAAAPVADAPVAAPGPGPTLLESRPRTQEEGKKEAAAPVVADVSEPAEPAAASSSEGVAPVVADVPASSGKAAEPAPRGESSEPSDEPAAEPAVKAPAKPAEGAVAEATAPDVVPEEETRIEQPRIEGEATLMGAAASAQKKLLFGACCGQTAWC
eukprot:CAMPEP_0171272478 /NCGR_PEP_ID=MMETSP0790-20130122/61780_1 /TAXON_ID=2925 /ORGANISM="Alexandrium catenella, Strain OF101" /LENGTH=166 /DNA_ID=CAMNT_0011741417 /DNA_START=82 /DNA_END=582 /DNA_ORIENTATION=-